MLRYVLLFVTTCLYIYIYKHSVQEEMSVFWEIAVTAILSNIYIA
jgi:hypothetical protein